MVLGRAVVWPFPRPSMCRPVPCACLRTVWRNVTTIVPATPCHQSNDVEPYRKHTAVARFGTLASRLLPALMAVPPGFHAELRRAGSTHGAGASPWGEQGDAGGNLKTPIR